MPSTIILGGLTLSSTLVWAERYNSYKVTQSVKRTLGGNQVVFTNALHKGQLITLQATEEYGWLDKTMVDGLTAMADSAGGSYLLEFGAEEITVMFRHHDAPALDLTPLIPRIDVDTSDYFIGSIKLFSV